MPYVPPVAESIQIFECEDTACSHVHILLMDAREMPIAQATINADVVQRLQRALYAKAAARPSAGGYSFEEHECPGHVASDRDPKVCKHCGVHVDSMRPPDDEG